MGRLFETFVRAETRPVYAPSESPAPAGAGPASVPPAEWCLPNAAEVPFVEVGWPRPEIGSTRPPHPAETAPAPSPAVPADARALLSVHFQPLPDRTAAARPGFGPDLIAYHEPHHPVSEQYHELRLGIAAQLPARRPHVLLFAGAAPASGTTTVVLNLAVAVARQEAGRVLVVDAHLARPAVADRLGVAGTPGLREVLGRTAPLVWGLHPTGLENLSVLPAGAGRGGVGSADAWAALLTNLRSRFDWILIDAPAWGEGAEALVAACDAAYPVLRQGNLDTPTLDRLAHDPGPAAGLLRGYVVTQS